MVALRRRAVLKCPVFADTCSGEGGGKGLQQASKSKKFMKCSLAINV